MARTWYRSCVDDTTGQKGIHKGQRVGEETTMGLETCSGGQRSEQFEVNTHFSFFIYLFVFFPFLSLFFLSIFSFIHSSLFILIFPPHARITKKLELKNSSILILKFSLFLLFIRSNEQLSSLKKVK